MSSSGSTFDYLHKMVLVGDAGVGKSSLLARYARSACPPEHKATVGVMFAARILTEVEGKRVRVQVWDTAGEDRYRAITRAYYRDAKAVILMFDLTNGASFRNLQKYLEEIRANVATNTPIILVGSKRDLVAESEEKQDVINEFIHENGISHCFLMSMKDDTNTNVDLVFHTAIKLALNAQALSQVAALVAVPKEKEKEIEANEEEKLLSGNNKSTQSSQVVRPVVSALPNKRKTGEEEKLLLENNKVTQSSEASLNYNPTLKEVLILRLQKYINRINGYLNDLTADDNGFDCGFWFFKKSRALSREANYVFAQKLLADLQASDGTADSMKGIFERLDSIRAAAIFNLSQPTGAGAIPASRLFTLAEKRACYKRGINSTELNEVIEIADHALRPSF